MFFNLDPLYVVFCDMYEFDCPVWFTLCRVLIHSWFILEEGRTFSIVLTHALALCNAACSILERIKLMKSLKASIEYYRQFQVLVETGTEGLREVAGLLMAGGFLIAVSCNYVVISAFDKLPVGIYLCFGVSGLVCYVGIHQTLPLVVYCNEISSELCCSIWPNLLATNKAVISKRSFEVLRRLIIARKLVTYYYGFAKFDKETKSNFYWNIIDFTITLVLV